MPIPGYGRSSAIRIAEWNQTRLTQKNVRTFGALIEWHTTDLEEMAILRWSQEQHVEWHHIVPGKPHQNAFNDSFNNKLRKYWIAMLAQVVCNVPCSGQTRMCSFQAW